MREPLEQAGQLPPRQARSRVDHIEAEFAAGAVVAGEQANPAPLGELHRIAHEVQQNLTQAIRIGHHQRREGRLALAQQVDPLGCRLAPADGRHVPHHLRRRHRDRTDLDLTGLELGEVQHIVDRGEQGLAGAAHAADIAPPVLAQSALAFEQIGEADHGRERRPQLMAHVGEELRLHGRGSLGFRLRLAKLFLERPLQRHVHHRAQHRGHPAVGVSLADSVAQDPPDFSVGPVHLGEHVRPAFAGGERPGGAGFAVKVDRRVGELPGQREVRTGGHRHAEDPAHLWRPVQLIGGGVQAPVAD